MVDYSKFTTISTPFEKMDDNERALHDIAAKKEAQKIIQRLEREPAYLRAVSEELARHALQMDENR